MKPSLPEATSPPYRQLWAFSGTTERDRGGQERVLLPVFTAQAWDTRRREPAVDRSSARPKRSQNEDWRRRLVRQGRAAQGLEAFS